MKNGGLSAITYFSIADIWQPVPATCRWLCPREQDYISPGAPAPNKNLI